MALDHSDRVDRVAVVNVVPTLDQFERMGGGPSLGFWPWYLLVQPAPFPERLLAADPAAFLELVFDTWPSDPAAIEPERRDAYLRAMTPSTIATMCADHRASFHLDRAHDEADRAAGRRIAAPLLVVIGDDETQLADAPGVWRRWATDVAAVRLTGGHFLSRGGAHRARGLARRVARRRSAGSARGSPISTRSCSRAVPAARVARSAAPGS